MEKITIKQYAIKHKLSVFNVMKMVKSGKLNVEVENVDEKETTYILIDDKKEKEISESIVPFSQQEEQTLQMVVHQLQIEVKSLRMEIEELKRNRV